ncbi:hypothetical protein MKX01_021999 [Papaver californicum]|nr:hypothetical protein MKX01_021999 [Papaver californicum]
MLLPMLTCATLHSFPPPSINPHNYNSSNNTTQPQIPQKSSKIVSPDVKKFKPVQANIKQSLFLYNLYLQMYANAGSMDEAQKLFDEMPERTLVSWTILMSGYARHGPKTETLLIFQKMVQNNNFKAVQPDSFVYGIVLRACSSLEYLDYGREIHCRILKTDGVMDSFVENALVMMYSSCGSIKDSARVFDGILQPNVVSWSSMFNGYVQNGLEEEGLRFFCMMIKAGIEPDVFAFSMVFGACATLGCLDFGIQVHCCIIKMGFCSSKYLQNSLMDFYAKCGDSSSLEQVFYEMPERNLVSWNTIIKGLVSNHRNLDALRLFRIMMNEALFCDDYTLSSVFQAITGLGALSQGREVHGYVIRAGYGSNIFVTNALIDLYSELLHLEQALKLCSLISDSEVWWDLLVQCCVRVQDHETMFKIVRRIQLCHGEISSSSAGHILNSCANPVLLNVGKQIQAYVTKRGLLSDPCSCNCLIRMYSKGGRIADATQAFSSMFEKNSDSWTSMISANVNYGHSSEAILLFTQMCKIHKSPNSITFTSALKAYAQMGLVDEAFRLLISMEKNYDIEPMIEHYSCIVEVLGRAGMFEEAEEFINHLFKLEPVPNAWKILLSGCRIHGDMNIAKYIAEKLVELEPTDATANLLLQQVLLTEGNWDDATKMKTNCSSMRSNASWIEVRNKVYEFTSDQVPAEAISIKLSELERTMKELCYVADRNHLLHNAEEEEYAGTGLHHTEMKALAFGLLSLAPGVPIRIMKNVRMCGDCHSACKFMSTFLGRDLVVKDTCKYHNFSNGNCSCKNAW